MLSILCEVDFTNETNNFAQLSSYSNLKTCNYLENLENNSFYSSFIELLKSTDSETDDISLKKFVTDFIANCGNDDERFNLVSVAISCLQLFVQANWLGPLPLQINPNLPKAVIESQLANDKMGDTKRKIFYLIDYYQFEV